MHGDERGSEWVGERKARVVVRVLTQVDPLEKKKENPKRRHLRFINSKSLLTWGKKRQEEKGFLDYNAKGHLWLGLPAWHFKSPILNLVDIKHLSSLMWWWWWPAATLYIKSGQKSRWRDGVGNQGGRGVRLWGSPGWLPSMFSV
ncbi:hypothetical protein J1N35_001443 [Gossypium stocksii]|uniref:Uncharacterized protein n=1 Tax=Gossypium stocksii TaxID=47602 RepID=A0A9D4AJM1_9ROSI|nr:hypothetical protein J1N35_001443 [Gossypium stocksii]